MVNTEDNRFVTHHVIGSVIGHLTPNKVWESKFKTPIFEEDLEAEAEGWEGLP